MLLYLRNDFSEYAQSLQIVLLVGLATSIEAIHRQLSW